MANHEMYSATAVAKGSMTIQRNFNMASTLNFQEAVEYDATSTYSLLDTVTYTDPDAGLLFEGTIVSKQPKASKGKEGVTWNCQDSVMRALGRTLYQTTAGSTFKYNVVGTSQSLTVKEILTDVLSSAVSTIASLDGYTVPSATTAVSPETGYSGQTYKAIIDDLMQQLPNWGYYVEYGASATTTLVVKDFVNDSGTATITIGTGADTPFNSSTQSTHVISLNQTTSNDGKYKYLTLEGNGDYTEYYRVAHLTPAWGSSTATASRLFTTDYPITDLFTVQDEKTDEWKFYRAPVIIYFLSGSAVLGYREMDPSEYGQETYDIVTPGSEILTDFFVNNGFTATTSTISNCVISYTARTANFKKTKTSTSTVLDGEKIIQDETWAKYTITKRWNLSATSTVVYNSSATMNAILDDYEQIYLKENIDGQVVTLKYGDIPYNLGDKITNFDNLRVGGIVITPEQRQITLRLTDDLRAMPLAYYARLRNTLADVQPSTKEKRRFGRGRDER